MEIVIDGKLPGAVNMARDVQLLSDFKVPIVRIYGWASPCISLGYSQKPEEELDLKKCRELGWDVVVRPTGGGIVFHNSDEVSYSVITSPDVLPKGLVESFKFISEGIVKGLELIGIKGEIVKKRSRVGNPLRVASSSIQFAEASSALFPDKEHSLSVRRQLKAGLGKLCFTLPMDYEIAVGGRKLVGAAQKRTKKAILQQGSIQLSPTDEVMEAVFGESFDRKGYLEKTTTIQDALGRLPAFEEVAKALKKSLSTLFGALE